MFGEKQRCWDGVLQGRITGNGGGVNDTVGNFLFIILSFNFSELLESNKNWTEQHLIFGIGSNWDGQQYVRVYCSRYSASTTCHTTRRPDRSFHQSSAKKRHCFCAIEIDNAHYLSQLFCTVYAALQ